VNKANIRPLTTLVDMSKINIFEVEECIICYSEAPNIILVPCGHLCCCMRCYKALETGSNTKSCPICRRKVDITLVHESHAGVSVEEDDFETASITTGITLMTV
jgi:hypothetical protein